MLENNRSQKGFAFLPFLLANWQLILISVLAISVYSYYRHCQSVKAEYSLFVNSVRAQGEAAEKAAKTKEAQDKKLKESVDRENQKLRTANAALSRSLRESRSSRSYVPPASPGSASPNLATFDRAELESAIRRLDEELSRIVEQGDQAVIDLDGAKRWASER